MQLSTIPQLSVCLWLLIQFARSQEIAATAASYAPTRTECPNEPLLRLAGSALSSNQTLCPEEVRYRQGRQAVVTPLWNTFFSTGPGKQTGYGSMFEHGSFQWPTLALAHSGGGYRAALYGAGVVQAFDSRTSSSPVAGVLQLSMYHLGLSGGNWLLGSLAMNGYPEMDKLVPTWLLDKDLVTPGAVNLISDGRYLDDIIDDAELKKKASYDISITDVWGRALAYHFLPGTTRANFYEHSSSTAHGAGILFSALQGSAQFQKFATPYPIVVSNHKPSSGSPAPTSGNFVTLATTVFETSPYEFGSFDPFLSAFTPTKYLGTNLKAGKPYLPSSAEKGTGACTTGFDQMSFVMATSSSLFNAVISTATGKVFGTFSAARNRFVKLFGRSTSQGSDTSEIDTAQYPNPFQGVNGPSGFDETNSEELKMVDGGENGENIPLNPVLAPARAVDIILAADGSADTDKSSPIGSFWPNGTAMITTFTRVTSVLAPGSASFPPVPKDFHEWVQKGYSTRPTFFGCNAPRRTGNGGYPLVVYLPNSPLPQAATGFYTNTTTFKLQYSQAESTAFLAAATATTTSPVLNGSADRQWSTCLSCALIDRARNRLSPPVPRSEACKSCFQRYCYADGVTE